MLRLKDITKNYKVAGGEIKVLKGLNVNFRKNEFVSILGPSGCGKTTTLNIVGGLDKYTSGDLIIAGKSTKKFTDRDWDIYRNHRIGFVFQSYNLIPHQTVLGNVELALTISGVSKEERVKRSIAALDRVGLQGEYYKRPNQLSGGQCQRVAIARALVNEPDILLADEPTGALDSKTSVQIMDLIKEISKDKLVIMVTHNSEIAEQYSNRIIRLVDGEITEDTNPYTTEEEQEEVKKDEEKENLKKAKKQKAKMSWWTAFKLSARNLLTKRGRTALTSIAGSIGIIGISAVLAVSTGVRTFIDNMQDDMLSGNPITIQETAYDLNVMMNGMTFDDGIEMVQEQGYVNVESMMEYLVDQIESMESFMVENDLSQEYVDYVKAMPKEYAALKLDYDIDLTNNIYTDFKVAKEIEKNVSLSAIKTIYTSVMKETQYKDQASMIASLGDTFKLAPSDSNYILSQYKLLDGDIAKEKDEIMIVVNKDSALTDLTLAQLGYYTQEEFINIAFSLEEGNVNYNPSLDKDRFTYSELMGKEFIWYPNDVVYNKTTNPIAMMTNPFTYNYTSDNFADGKKEEGLKLKIVGVLEPNDDINFGCLQTGVYYTDKLVDYVLDKSAESQIVQFISDANKPENAEHPLYKNYVDGFTSGHYTTTLNGQPYEVDAGITYTYEYYYDENLNDDIAPTSKTAVGYVGTLDVMSSMIGGMMGMEVGDMYKLSMRNIGGNSLANDITIYPMDFEMKDRVTEYLDKWNEKGDIEVNGKVISFEERSEIVYSDTLEIIIFMIDTMIDVVTIALIAFTSLSLVVSCVMIAIITYVSVVERVKEIGVIRSLGGSKNDVSNLFNAETLIIGLGSGLFGVGITYLISLIVNIIVRNAAGFSIMILPISSAIIMVTLSVGLTVLSGLIPSRKAAEQDPVVALRTE